MKHLIKSLLTALLLLCSAVINAHEFEVDGIYYNVISEQGKTVEVVKCSKVHNNKLVIPSSVTYEGCTYIVTTIGSFGTIDDCKDITSITIPNSIESIDNVNFPSIKELIIEDGETALSANYRVIDIDPDDRFIEGITGGFPNSIESLYLGRNLSYTRYVNFGMAQKYEYSPCGRCASLKKIVIGDKVTSIGDNLFDGCRKLEEITIGNSVTSIGQNAFYNCINLKAVYISDLAAWCNIYYKTYVRSPFNSNAEYSYACNPLYYADKLYLNGVLLNANRKFVLPDNITIIRDATFATLRIDSLIIPNNITKIGPRAFLNDSIKYICIEDGSTQLVFEDSGSMIVNNPPNFSSLETLHIGRPVSNCAFYNNPSLKNVKINTKEKSEILR